MPEETTQWSNWDVYDFPNGKPGVNDEDEDEKISKFLFRFDRLVALGKIINMTEEELSELIEGD